MFGNVRSAALRAGFAGAACLGLLSAQVLAQDDSTGLQLKFDEAMEKRSSGELHESIRLYEQILQNQPSLSRARAELALTYYQVLNFAAARAEAQKLLADPTLPVNVRGNLQALVERIDRDSRPHVLTPFATIGYGSDSNVNVGPGSETIQIGGASLTLVPGSTRQSDNFTQFHAGLSHRYLAPRSVALGGQSAAFVWQSGAGYFTQNYNSLSRFDLDVATVSTGPALIIAGKARAGLVWQYDEIGIGHKRLAGFTGLTASLALTRGSFEFSLDSQAQYRDFFDPANSGRSGHYRSLGLGIGRSLLEGRAAINLGTRWFNENADTQRFGNRGDEFYIGATWRAWSGGTLYARIGERRPHYKDVEPLFNEIRADRESRQTIGLSHTLQEGVARDVTLSLSGIFTRNHSSVAIYQYQRDQITFTASKNF